MCHTKKVVEQNNNVGAVSLIVCAKNELENLKLHLPLWLEQELIDFEIIIVNDNSTDGSFDYLFLMASKYNKLRIINLDAHENEVLKGKRFALAKGIKAAQCEFLVLTDADCAPNSKQWLKLMAESFAAETEIVLGFSPYHHKPGFLNLLIRYETLMTALQYLSFAKIGLPYMGVGRNIGYKKSILSEDVFLSSNHTASGDDDLLVLILANHKNVSIQIHPDSFCYSVPEHNFKAWFKQKQRHYSTAQYYTLPLKLAVGGFGALNLLFYILMFALLWQEVSLLSVLSIYLSKNLAFVILNYKCIRFFKEAGILKNILYIDVVYLILLIINHLKAFQVKHGWS